MILHAKGAPMDPLIKDKLLDLLVNVIAILLSGGLLTYFIESRRYKRERLSWQREDRMIAIDIPRSDIAIERWKITEKTSSEEKLEIYENNLLDTIKTILVVVEFVIRNTTAAEVIITHYDAGLFNLPAGDDVKNYFDLETHDYMSVKETGAIKLKPYASIPRFLVITSKFDKDRILEKAPSTVLISITTSNGVVGQVGTILKILPKKPDDVLLFEGSYYSRKDIEKTFPEDDLPF